MVRPTSRITRPDGSGNAGGVTLSERVWAIVAAARREAGVPDSRSRVTKGSWARANRLSSDTHAGGGAGDLGAVLMAEAEALRLVDALRRRGAVAWLRSPRFGWPAHLSPAHIHFIVRDEPGLSVGAARQVKAFDAGRNGLAGNGKDDPHPRPAWEPFRLWGEPAPWPGHRLQLGSSGPAVRDLQRALEIVADGRFGPQTKARVKRHQLTRPGLWPADGVCGPATYMSAINWGWR